MRAFNQSAKRRRVMQPALERCEGRILLTIQSYHTGSVNVRPPLVYEPPPGGTVSLASPSLANGEVISVDF